VLLGYRGVVTVGLVQRSSLFELREARETRPTDPQNRREVSMRWVNLRLGDEIMHRKRKCGYAEPAIL